MMRRGTYMDLLPQVDHIAAQSSWFPPAARSWTAEENKWFESELAGMDLCHPDWEKVARAIPGRTVREVVNHFKNLQVDVQQVESGLVPMPVYGGGPNSFTLQWDNNGGYGPADFRNGFRFGGGCRKRHQDRTPEQGTKKVVPWTEEEPNKWRIAPNRNICLRTATRPSSPKHVVQLRSLRPQARPFPDVVSQLPPLSVVAAKLPSVLPPSSKQTEDTYIGLDVLERIVDGSEKPSNFKFSLLELITKNFSDELKIGHGGCGVVYKGILRNRIIAVKRLSNSHTIEDRMFYQELQSLMRVKHQNIVQFLGYCSHTEEQARELSGNLVMAQLRERLLCFEYISNGSLQDVLADELRGLDWHTRYQIIKGICEGLHHLHKENHILHMDLKPSNILLDDQMVPKIIDFGLSRLDDKTRTMTVKRLITLGYCAPEYQGDGKMSSKSDIYSLGVIVKELVTGSKEKPSIPEVLRRWKHRWNKSANKTPPILWYKQVTKCLELAIRCTDTKPTNRPHIWDIICELNKVDSGYNVSDVAGWLELEGMIGVEPLKIHLPFQLNKKISCSIELSNNETNGYDFAFMISTTSLRRYCIDPDRGIVPLGFKCNITITLQEQERAPPHDYCRDEFSVQSTRMYGNHASYMDMDITQDMFNEEPGKVVDNVDLIVVLDVPPSSTSDQ